MPVPDRTSRPGRRLGSPVISVNQSARYLRQRIIADGERKAWNDRKWRRRVWIGGICIALYILVGRDLIGMTQAVGRATSADVRQDIHDAAVSMRKIAEARERDRDLFSPSPVDFDSPATEEGRGDAANPTTWEELSPN